MMLSLYMIIMVLAATAQTKESIECDLSGRCGALWCFGVLGEPLFLRLPTGESTKISLTINNTKTILTIVNNEVMQKDEEHKNYSFTKNGTFKFDKLMKKDVGDYELSSYGPNGALLCKLKMHLDIQAPVSEPTVSQTCSSPDHMTVTCSSDGQNGQFTLYLDGQLLMQTYVHNHCPSSCTSTTQGTNQDTPSNITIRLNGRLNGKLMCQLQNSVSTRTSVIHLTSCEESTDFLLVTVIIIISAVILLTMLALLLGIKRLRGKTTPSSVNEGSRGSLGAYPSYLWTKAVFTLDMSPVHHRADI